MFVSLSVELFIKIVLELPESFVSSGIVEALDVTATLLVACECAKTVEDTLLARVPDAPEYKVPEITPETEAALSAPAKFAVLST